MFKLKIIKSDNVTQRELDYFFSFIRQSLPFVDYQVVSPTMPLSVVFMDMSSFLYLHVRPSNRVRYLILRKSNAPFRRYHGTEEDSAEGGRVGGGEKDKGAWYWFTPSTNKRKGAITIVHELGHSFGLVFRNKNLHCENRNCIMYPGAPASTFCKSCAAELNRFK